MKNPRINITLDQVTIDNMAKIASKKHVKIASLAREFILDSIEKEEDLALSAMADKLDNDNEESISHEDAWK